MIIRIIATALIQCTMRTQAGWITLAAAGTACSSLAARLDMAHPWRRFDSYYTPGTDVSLLPCCLSRRCPQGMAVTKKRAGLPRPAITHPVGDSIRTRAVLRRRHQHGVDHVDHAVRLIDVRNRDHRGAPLGIDDPDLAVPVLYRQLFALGGLELLAVREVRGLELAGHHVVGQDFGQGGLAF